MGAYVFDGNWGIGWWWKPGFHPWELLMMEGSIDADV